MIFVAVGTQVPFDRLVRAVDAWATRHGRDDVFAQIGRDAWRPNRLEWAETLSAKEFEDRVAGAEVVVSHAGMGTVLTALDLGKPLLIMPRRAALREHRNDHQVATARKLAEMDMADVAMDETELVDRLDHLELVRAGRPLRDERLDGLLGALERFIEEAKGR